MTKNIIIILLAFLVVGLYLEPKEERIVYYYRFMNEVKKDVTFDLSLETVNKDSKVTELNGPIILNKPFTGIFEFGAEKIKLTIKK